DGIDPDPWWNLAGARAALTSASRCFSGIPTRLSANAQTMSRLGLSTARIMRGIEEVQRD
ncbi:MAG: hypothetical protein PVF63_01445, partial [Gammaproteobacteria bacterium]